MFSGTTICDNWDSVLMGPQYSEIQAQCTSTSKLFGQTVRPRVPPAMFLELTSEWITQFTIYLAGRWPSRLHLQALLSAKMPKATITWELEDVSEKCFQIEPRGRGLWDCCIIAAGEKYCVKCARSLLQRHHESSVSSTQRPSLRTLVSVLPDSRSCQPPLTQPQSRPWLASPPLSWCTEGREPVSPLWLLFPWSIWLASFFF